MTTVKRIALVVLLVAPSAFGDSLPPDLVQTVHRYELAQTRDDVAALARLVSDDFILVNSNASVENKKQFLADFNLPGFKIEPYVIRQRIDKAWGDGAVTGGLLRLNWTQNHQRHSRVLRIAYVWRKQAGHWKAVYAQVTRVPAGSAAPAPPRT